MVSALETASGAMESPLLRQAIRTAAERVREGQSLHAALAATGVIPGLVTEMVEVGESTGALPQMLTSAAEFYEEDLNARLGVLVALVEPVLLVGVGTTVLIILVALYLPIFSVGTLAR
jgi:type IV pilus assembly protein PilC